MPTNWIDNFKKKIGYKGCRNCKNQIEPLRTCEWHEQIEHTTLHLICPKWEKKTEGSEDERNTNDNTGN